MLRAAECWGWQYGERKGGAAKASEAPGRRPRVTFSHSCNCSPSMGAKGGSSMAQGGKSGTRKKVGLGRTERVAIAHAAASEGGPRMQLGEQQASANKAVALSVVPVMANGGINNSRKNSNPRPREKIRRKRPNERQTAGRRYTLLRQLPLLAGYLHQLQQRSVPTNLGWFGITCSPAASIISRSVPQLTLVGLVSPLHPLPQA